MQRYLQLLIVPVLGIILFLPLSTISQVVPATYAGSEVRYFPETGHFLRGEFRLFWENHGGVKIFGFPITEEYLSSTTGRVTQYFERARFELAYQNSQTYVELGKLGIELTQGRFFPTVGPVPDSRDWRYFSETQHVIQKGFKQIWETNGGLPIFGYPISEELSELFPDGTLRTVQYFERARFEYWPEYPPGKRVIISDLGRLLAPRELQMRLDETAAPGAMPAINPQPAQRPMSQGNSAASSATPVPATSSSFNQILPMDVYASISPKSGTPGRSFSFQASCFQGNELVGIWLTSPDGTTIDLQLMVKANDNGSLSETPIIVRTKPHYRDGIWSVNAKGLKGGCQAIAYFRLSRLLSTIPGSPEKLGIILHDHLQVKAEAFVMPLAAPPETSFMLMAYGYQPGESISSWATAIDGNTVPLDASSAQVDKSGFLQFQFADEKLTEGIYTIVARGNKSGISNSAVFKITNDYRGGFGTPRPANVNGKVTPSEGAEGTTFHIRGQQLKPRESLEFWITDPSGSYTFAPEPATADDQGRIGYTPPLDIVASQEYGPGVYGFHFRGKQSGTRVDVYYTVTK